MRLIWTARALADLLEVKDFVGRDRPGASARLIRRLRERARRAARHPRVGRIVPEFGRETIREVFLENYRIVYEVDKKAIVVLTVFEGHRLLPLRERS